MIREIITGLITGVLVFANQTPSVNATLVIGIVSGMIVFFTAEIISMQKQERM